MPLRKFWRRLFHPDVEFQVLKSNSSVELSCYPTVASSASIPILSNRRRTPSQAKSKKIPGDSRSSSVGRDVLESGKRFGRGRGRQQNRIPRYYSQYESFGCSPPIFEPNLTQDDLAVIINQSASAGIKKSVSTFSNFSPPPLIHQKTCIVFCFMENKPSSSYLEKSMGPDELAGALLVEDEKPNGKLLVDENFRVALNLCRRYQQHDDFKEGALLKAVESGSVHSYVQYASFVVDSQSHLERACQLSKLNRKSAQDMKYRQHQGAYEELFSIVRKPEPLQSRLPTNSNAGHIVIGFKILTLDNIDRLESTWMDWSGAGEITRCAPKQWLLKRITFHRQIFTTPTGSGRWLPAPDGFMYILLCEFENLMEPPNAVMGCDLVERLRLRGCGHVGIYKVQWMYASPISSADGTPTIAPQGEKLERSGTMEKYCSCESDNTTDALIKLSPVDEACVND